MQINSPPLDIIGDREAVTDIFVYGTLLSGERNHQLLYGMMLLGLDSLKDTTLYDAGEYPYARLEGDGRVWGERYRVDGLCLEELDALEEHPHWYFRRWVQLDSLNWAWVYEGPLQAIATLPIIPSGNWKQR